MKKSIVIFIGLFGLTLLIIDIISPNPWVRVIGSSLILLQLLLVLRIKSK